MARKNVGPAPTKDFLDTFLDAFTGEAFGALFPEKHGIRASNTQAQNTTAWAALMQKSHDSDKPIYFGQWYTGSISFGNANVQTVGPGGLEAPADGTQAISIINTLGAAVACTPQVNYVGPRNGKPSVPRTETTTALTGITPATLNQFVPDDVWQISSQDRYSWDTTFPQGNVYKAELVTILGVAFIFTPGAGTVKENDTIVGVNSGATALVGSVAPVEGATTLQVMVKTITGTFGASESISVAGTTVGTIGSAGSVILKHRLADTYPTNPVVSKLPNWKCSMTNLRVRTIGDSDALVGTANRASAMIRLINVVNPEITGYEQHSAWASGILAIDCYGGVIQGSIHGKGNNASNNDTANGNSNQLSEQQYTYGAEAYGATRGTRFDLVGRNIRHTFTTNPRGNGTGAYNSANRHLYGTPRDLTISGLAIDNWGSGWDNHEGGENLHYLGCINRYTAGGYRYLSGGPGFNNRSQNTTYENCTDYGSRIGFYDATGGDTLTQMSIIRYKNCAAIDYQSKGFSLPNPSASPFHKIVLEGVMARGDGTADISGGGAYNQIGFELGGTDTDIFGLRTERFNSWGIRMAGTTAQHATYKATINMQGLYGDFSESPSNDALFIEWGSGTGQPANLNVIDEPQVKQKLTAPAMPAAFFKNLAGNSLVRLPGSGKVINVNGTTTIPMTLVSAGAPTFGVVPGTEPPAVTYATALAGVPVKVYRTANGTGPWPAARPTDRTDVPFIAVGTDSPAPADPTWLIARDERLVTATAIPAP